MKQPEDSKLNCPYCGAEMEYGVILGSRGGGIPWLPRKDRSQKPPFFLFTYYRFKKLGGRHLGAPTYFGRYPGLDTWICSKCDIAVCK